jgi:salicylate hydroxylase
MDTLRDRWVPYSQRAARPSSITIVGAGIGGLTAGIALSQTGHSVTILERVNKIDEVGAGIQLAPNASRIMNRLRVLEEIMEHATVLERVSIRYVIPNAMIKKTTNKTFQTLFQR